MAEELAELRQAMDAGDAGAVNEELGDVLFAVVNVARHLQVDPESSLRSATAKFATRLGALEALATAQGVELTDLDLAGLDRLWDQVKAGATAVHPGRGAGAGPTG